MRIRLFRFARVAVSADTNPCYSLTGVDRQRYVDDGCASADEMKNICIDKKSMIKTAQQVESNIAQYGRAITLVTFPHTQLISVIGDGVVLIAEAPIVLTTDPQNLRSGDMPVHIVKQHTSPRGSNVPRIIETRFTSDSDGIPHVRLCKIGRRTTCSLQTMMRPDNVIVTNSLPEVQT